MPVLTPGTYKHGKPYRTDAAILERYLFVEIGSDAEHVAVTNALSDIPVGICRDTASTAETPIGVDLLGVRQGTILVRAGETIAAGDMLIPGTNGRARVLPTAPGTYYICGRALSSGDDGELIEVALSFPQQRIVV